MIGERDGGIHVHPPPQHARVMIELAKMTATHQASRIDERVGAFELANPRARSTGSARSTATDRNLSCSSAATGWTAS
jgi:hypothetical protein